MRCCRAVGFEDVLRVDHAAIAPASARPLPALQRRRAWGPARRVELRALLAGARSPQEDRRKASSTAALAAGGDDNATALVVDVDRFSARRSRRRSDAASPICPLRELPQVGEVIDDFRLDSLIADGRYSRLLQARRICTIGETWRLKFPHPRVAEEASYRLAFVNEAWVAARVRSPFIGEIVELAAGRRTRLYSAMPFYDGETLEARLRRAPKIDLAEGVAIATRLARAHRRVASRRNHSSRHEAGQCRSSCKTVGCGSSISASAGRRISRTFRQQDIPGTPSYMAPELFQGASWRRGLRSLCARRHPLSDFANAYPLWRDRAFQQAALRQAAAALRQTPDLPAWLDAADRQGNRGRPARTLWRRAGICIRIREWRGHVAAGQPVGEQAAL